MRSRLAKIILLAALYIMSGKIGLLLALPPGYATIIWPASGIAIGMLLTSGAGLWPGVLIGSFILNTYISGAWTPTTGLDLLKTGVAFSIAVGSTLQALTGCWLIKRIIGKTLNLDHVRQIGITLLLAGPVSCIVAATVGVGTLFATGILPAEKISQNWITWWVGDTFGVIVFLPLLVISANKHFRLTWRGEPLGKLPLLAFLVVLLPLGLTFYSWKIASESAYNQNLAEFQSLAVESEKALLHRLESYQTALLGGAGFFQGSETVSREEWRSYVETIDVKKNFPGINGIGWINALLPEQVQDYVDRVHAEGLPNFHIHPQNKELPNYIINYIEPFDKNSPALGLNIAFEDHRRQAAELSRDTGLSTITKRIVLLQDEQKTAGFLLLYPMYNKNLSHDTVEQRRSALQGWVYAPFIAKDFMASLTSSQGHLIRLEIHDGKGTSPETQIYDSNDAGDKDPSVYNLSKDLNVFQQTWHISWQSTSEFEQLRRNENAFLILIGGLVFTVMIGVFLMLTTVQRAETLEWMAGEKSYTVPTFLFVAITLGAYFLYETLHQKELAYVNSLVEEEGIKAHALLNVSMNETILALKRMARRWSVANGTPFVSWQDDAKNYTTQVSGLERLEWRDNSYGLRWSMPPASEMNTESMSLLGDKAFAQSVSEAADRRMATVTPPFNVEGDSKGFVINVPLMAFEKPDGFLACFFSVRKFFSNVLSNDASLKYALVISYDGKPYFTQSASSPLADDSWSYSENLQLLDKIWNVKIVPTETFVNREQSSLPMVVFAASLLIAALSSLTLRSTLISKLRLHHLGVSNRFNKAILSSTDYLVIATDPNGTIISFNKAAEKALGYSAATLIGKASPGIFHDPKEVLQRADELTAELGYTIEPGFDVFITRPLKDGVESREWTYIRKNKTRFPINLTVNTLRNALGEITGFLGVIEDVTERKKQQQALRTSEETFRSAMEDASIGMALVGLDGRWLKVNKALCDSLGYTENEMSLLDFQTITHPDDLEEDLDFLQKMLDGKIKTYQIEKRYFHKSGRIIWALLNVSMTRDSEGKPDYFISQIQDITERKEMERLKSEFISIVSHELRTPLTSIRGSLGLMIGTMTKDLPEKVNKLIDIAHKNSERLILLINDMLDIEKIASGQMRFEIKAEHLKPLLQTAVESNQPYADKFNIDIELHAIDERLAIKADPQRFMQVMANLISNAAKFSDTGKSIEISAAAKGKFVRISVRDHGQGIAEEFRTRIFSKFSQEDSSATRSKGGTGLGLHITKQLVEHMGGTIGFETTAGEGTEFWFELPNALAPAEVVTDEDYLLHYMERDKSIPVVLHVEDDRDLSTMLATALQGKVTVVPATSLLQAEKLLKEVPFSVILLDLALPDGSGLNLLKHKQDYANPAAPIIILSATEISDDVKQVVSAALVKSKMSEKYVVDTIMNIINKDQAA